MFAKVRKTSQERKNRVKIFVLYTDNQIFIITFAANLIRIIQWVAFLVLFR